MPGIPNMEFLEVSSAPYQGASSDIRKDKPDSHLLLP